MAAQTPEVSSRLIDFQNGPVLLQPSASPASRTRAEQDRHRPGGEHSTPQGLERVGRGRLTPALKTEPRLPSVISFSLQCSLPCLKWQVT